MYPKKKKFSFKEIRGINFGKIKMEANFPYTNLQSGGFWASDILHYTSKFFSILWHVAVNKAYKVLVNDEGMKRCQEIIEEAKARVDEMVRLL